MSDHNEHAFLKINLLNNDIALIFGGSCLLPTKEALLKANYFVALDESGLVEREPGVPLNYFFPIEDGSIPENIENFHKMIDYLCTLLKHSVNLHIGSTESQGRTVLVMSAIVQKMCKPLLDKLNISAIDYVRNLYCIKAVVNKNQELFLIQHCNVKKTETNY